MQIKLLTLDSSEYTLEQQLRKVREEHHEVLSAKGTNNLIMELFDLMQSCKTALEILNRIVVYRAEDYVKTLNKKHIAKLKLRHAQGKIKLLEDEE